MRPASPNPAYEPVAAEYYDKIKHPTCANFNDLSSRYVGMALDRYLRQGVSRTVDLGAGRSVVAAYCHRHSHPLGLLTLVDSSPAMLNYSSTWGGLGASLLTADARSTGLDSGIFDIAVASLGDPFNGPAFWIEISRLLKPDGIAIHTSPAPEWANRFRDAGDRDLADFVVDSNVFRLPSFVPEWLEQKRWLGAAGLRLLDRCEFFRKDLSGGHSVKLDVFPPSSDGPIIVGFAARLD